MKIGINEHTKSWAAKEIKVYDFLSLNNYDKIPELLSSKSDQSGFALEALLPEDGWDWLNTWTNDRLEVTLQAMDQLALIKPDSKYEELLKAEITDADDGWVKLMESDELQNNLMGKLENTGFSNLLSELNEHVQISSEFSVAHDTLVHYDVRADNAPWNKNTNEVKLVDWNWLELGDRRIDITAMLVHIQNSGFDVMERFSERLDADALHWIAGFWLESAATPIWEGGPEHLRTIQLKAGLTALELRDRLLS